MNIAISSNDVDFNASMEAICCRLPEDTRCVLQQLLRNPVETSILENMYIDAAASATSWSNYCTVLLNYCNMKFLEIAVEIFSNVYSSLSTEKAKAIAKESVVKMGLDSLNASLVYGEIDCSSFASILERVNPPANSVFVDLGHGTGKALICASLFFSSQFRQIHGIELLADLYTQSIEAIEKYKTIVSNSEKYLSIFECSNITVCQGDILNIGGDLDHSLEKQSYLDWTTGDVIFANSTCFDEDLMGKLSVIAIAKMKPGAVFISLTRPLLYSSSEFMLEGKYQYVMSWGTATCYIQRKL